MYKHHFAFHELPFSIVPSSRFLYLSQRHKEAIFRLTSGLGEGGGFAMLTGEVGTGKTTVAKAMLDDLDAIVDQGRLQAGFILNPTFSESELLEAICDEFSIAYSDDASLKQLSQAIHQFLIESYAQGRQTLLVIDEAQHLSAQVLEQLRLLTNLETEQHKLLKVLLIGQPELQQKLQMPILRQLAQRITGRYHLLPLDSGETANYVRHRLTLAGGDPDLFSSRSLKWIATQTQGIPRLINLVCDAALRHAYSSGELKPSHDSVQRACDEVMSFQPSFQVTRPRHSVRASGAPYWFAAAIGIALSVVGYQSAALWADDLITQHVARSHPIQHSEPTINHVLPDTLKTALDSAINLEQGLANLYRVWGYQASVLDKLCLENEQSVFQCQLTQGDLATLAQANRPVLLTLSEADSPRYAVLYQLDSEHATLLLDGQLYTLPSAELERRWNGEYRHIWRRYWVGTLKPGMEGEAIAALDAHLSSILDQPSTQSARFDEVLEQKVKLFQRWQGLTVDGIAGSKTLRKIEQMSLHESPRLDTRMVTANHSADAQENR